MKDIYRIILWRLCWTGRYKRRLIDYFFSLKSLSFEFSKKLITKYPLALKSYQTVHFCGRTVEVSIQCKVAFITKNNFALIVLP